MDVGKNLPHPSPLPLGEGGTLDRNGLLLGQDFFEPCNDGFYFFVGQHLNADSD